MSSWYRRQVEFSPPVRDDAPVPLKLDLATPVTTLVLIGGGEFSFGQTREIDEMLIARMPKEKRRVAFLPTASGSTEYAAHFGSYLRSLAADLEVINVPIYRPRDARRQKNLNYLLEAGLIYLGGGVTQQLLAALRESAAELAIRDAASQGTVVAAIGGAAAAFGVRSHDARGDGAIPGLSWIEGAVIEAGFAAGNDTPLRRLMSLPEVSLGLGIPLATAIVVGADGNCEVIGDGQLAAFRRPR